MPAEGAAPAPQKKELVGVDVFVHWSEGDRDTSKLADRLVPLAGDDLKLEMITNRGVKVWPDGFPETFRTDHWRCRFSPTEGSSIDPARVVKLLSACAEAGIDFIKTEHLYTFDGERGFSLGQGQ